MKTVKVKLLDFDAEFEIECDDAATPDEIQRQAHHEVIHSTGMPHARFEVVAAQE